MRPIIGYSEAMEDIPRPKLKPWPILMKIVMQVDLEKKKMIVRFDFSQIFFTISPKYVDCACKVAVLLFY